MSSNRHPDVEECFLPTGLPKTGQNWSHHYPTLALTFSPVCMRRGPEWGEGGHWNMQCWPGSPSEVYFPFQVQFKRVLQNSLKTGGTCKGRRFVSPVGNLLKQWTCSSVPWLIEQEREFKRTGQTENRQHWGSICPDYLVEQGDESLENKRT